MPSGMPCQRSDTEGMGLTSALRFQGKEHFRTWLFNEHYYDLEKNHSSDPFKLDSQCIFIMVWRAKAIVGHGRASPIRRRGAFRGPRFIFDSPLLV